MMGLMKLTQSSARQSLRTGTIFIHRVFDSSNSIRFISRHIRNQRDSTYYAISVAILAVGASFAAIPAYRMFCEATSFGGLTQVAKDFEHIATMEKVKNRLIRVKFSGQVPSSMQWKFKPTQEEIYVHPGETALAFFTAMNPTDKPIVGISSYNITPFEQILNPGQQVDLPVFFYIDPDYANDPSLECMDNILLNYTFFEAKAGLKLPDPFDRSSQVRVQ